MRKHTGKRMFCTTERYCCSLMKPSSGEKALQRTTRQRHSGSCMTLRAYHMMRERSTYVESNANILGRDSISLVCW